jgi:hypothetical protein
LDEYLKVERVFEEEEEGIEVEVDSGFDSRAIRLTGNLTTDGPPFRGVVRHRGWRVTQIELPHSTMQQREDWILVPAEVEVV